MKVIDKITYLKKKMYIQRKKTTFEKTKRVNFII